MIAELNISVTDFIRTTDAHHVAAVQYGWQSSLRLAIFTKFLMSYWPIRDAKLSFNANIVVVRSPDAVSAFE